MAHSLVSSDHFIGNRRSKDPRSPAYVPSVFPKIYKRQSTNEQQQNYRYQRNLQRQDNKQKAFLNSNKVISLSSDSAQSQMVNNIKNSVSAQVAFDFDGTEHFTFKCTFTKTNCDVMTQACIPVTYNNTFQKPNTVDMLCGPDISFVNLNYFSGFHSILNEMQLKDLTGTTFKIFNLLLSLIPGSSIKLKMLIYNIPKNINHIKHFIFWPNKKTVNNTLPKAFKQNYPNFWCIIDCTEIKTEQPNTVEQRVYMFSRYKNAYTVKVLVAINPSGLIYFLSKSYGGRTSDSFITNDSGFLSKLEPGDEVLADKGFSGIKVALEGSKSILIVPPILHNGHFSEDEVLDTYTIASVRIHIERIFAKLKTYLILNKITINLLPYVEVIHICCVLTNLQNPIINDK
ncbi:hypothetical protein QTP88_004662 [Uroleucon formosanum]